jgi:transcriptional regulator with XRE-family HTH domain
MSFAKNLQAIMQERNLNQTDLSNITGISKPSLSQYLNGKNEPYKSRIAHIADSFGVPTSRLVGTMQTDELAHADDLSPIVIPAQRISIEEAARRLGKAPQFIRMALQNGVAPFGFATKVSGSTYDYHISPKLFAEYIGA